MVLCFDISSTARLALDELMRGGHFQNPSEAVSIALINYHVIHQALSKGHGVAIEDAAPHEESPRTSALESKTVKPNPQVPEMLRLEESYPDGLHFADVPTAEAVDIAPARWLFGQYNKILPVKVASRCLLNMLRENLVGIPLGTATQTISTEAWALGDYLYMLDQRSSRSREDAFAAAFPITAGNPTRSRTRFANQFVGDLRQPKKPEDQARGIKFKGLPSALKFIICTDAKNPVLNLSKPGAEFAALQNPILEAGAKTPDRKFSDAEIEFMLAHLGRAVPEEISAYNAIIDSIKEGANTPDTVDQYLCQKFDLEIAVRAEEENQITQTFLTTQRTGAISRMVDLGLVGREKSGLHVSYVITRLGEDFRAANSRGQNQPVN